MARCIVPLTARSTSGEVMARPCNRDRSAVVSLHFLVNGTRRMTERLDAGPGVGAALAAGGMRAWPGARPGASRARCHPRPLGGWPGGLSACAAGANVRCLRHPAPIFPLCHNIRVEAAHGMFIVSVASSHASADANPGCPTWPTEP